MPGFLRSSLLLSSAARNLMVVAACLALTLPASSQGDARDFGEMLSRADANGDGAVTREELVGSRQNIFSRLDRNEDGVVSSKDRPPPLVRKRFEEAFSQLSKQFDADSNGILTHDEFVSGPTPGFDVGDVDGDDVLTAEEISNLKPGAAD